MPQFDDLVADLMKENLLDETPWENMRTSSIHEPKLAVSVAERIVKQPQNRSLLSSLSSFQEPEFPDFVYALAKKPPSELNLDVLNFTEIISKDEIELEIPEDSFGNFDEPSKLIRRKTKKTKLNGKYCPQCRIKHPRIQIYCQFCQKRILSNLYFYSFIFFSSVIFAGAFWLFLFLKLSK